MLYEYPHTDLNQPNLDGIIKLVRKMDNDMSNFTAFNKLRFAGDHNPNIEYYSWTIVEDPTTGDGYISVKAVPSGIVLSNREYWEKISSYNALYAAYNERIEALETSVESAKADIEQLQKNFVTPEMFGAVGDGVTDDTEAVQAALSNEEHLPILMTKKYLITDEIVVGGWNNYTLDANNSEIIYNGDGSAVVIQKVFYGKFAFGIINAPNGTAIEFRATTTLTYSAYSKLTFGHLIAGVDCIYVNVQGKGYSNQIQVYGGRCSGGGVAVHMYNDPQSNKYSINEWQLNYIGVEGVTTGFKFESADNTISGVNIVYPRYREDTDSTTLVKINGRTSFMRIDCDAIVKPTQFDIDDGDNQLFVNAPWVEDGRVISYRSYLRKGAVSNYHEILAPAYEKYISKIVAPIVISSPSSVTDPLSASLNPMTVAEDMIAEGNENRVQLVCTYNNTGFEQYSPVPNGLYVIMQRQNTARIMCVTSDKIYINYYAGGGWYGWKTVQLT